MKIRIYSTLLILSVIILSCKKKETKTEEPTPTPTPVTPSAYSTFSSTIAVVDYTAPTGAYVNYSVNISLTTTVKAYIVAEGIRIDSLTLNIAQKTDFPPGPTPGDDICGVTYWNTLLPVTKNFKVKNGVADSLEIYENGIKVVTQGIGHPSWDPQSYAYSGNAKFHLPNVWGGVCSDYVRFKLVH